MIRTLIRTFIAIELPQEIHRKLDDFGKELKRSRAMVSWVKPENIHLTLKFLGDVSPEQLQTVQGVLEKVAAGTAPFRLQAFGCGAFPSLKQMRIVWVGLRGGNEPLNRLQKEIESSLIPVGFKAEDRPFKPHLTIGRVKGRQGSRALQEILMANQTFEAEAFDVTEVVLYKSDLRPEGARYTPLFRASFAGEKN